MQVQIEGLRRRKRLVEVGAVGIAVGIGKIEKTLGLVAEMREVVGRSWLLWLSLGEEESHGSSRCQEEEGMLHKLC